MSETAQAENFVKDTDMDSFMEDVINMSNAVPVVVDFWAPWCGPCKTLGPMLEKAVNAQNGKMRMAKIDIDQNKMIAQQMQIQSVPTVMMFIGGRPVDGFMGAVPESQINDFIDKGLAVAEQAGLTGENVGMPTPEDILTQANEALTAGEIAPAMEMYSVLVQQIEEDTDVKMAAVAGLINCYLYTDNQDQAKAIFDSLTETQQSHDQLASIKASFSLTATPADDAALIGLKNAAAQNPDNMQAQFAYAEGMIAAGQMADGTHLLLDMIAKDREWQDKAARTKLLTVFEALGNADPITQAARKRLSAILFS